jgi:hypothetical protein
MLNVVYRVVMTASAIILLLIGLFLVIGTLVNDPEGSYLVAGVALISAALVPWLQRNKVLRPGENPLDIVTGEEFKADAAQKGI